MGLKSIKVKHKERAEAKGHHKFILHNIKTGEDAVFEYDNLIPTVAHEMTAKRWVGTGNDSSMTYGAVGTSVVVPLSGDTILGTELDRKIFTTRSFTSNQAFFTTYFGPSEANGALTEFAGFGEAATGAADSGTMGWHSVINVTKTSAFTMTVESTITFL